MGTYSSAGTVVLPILRDGNHNTAMHLEADGQQQAIIRFLLTHGAYNVHSNRLRLIRDGEKLAGGGGEEGEVPIPYHLHATLSPSERQP